MRKSGMWLPALLLAAAPVLAREAEWPTWRGPARDGRSPDKGLLKKWPGGGPKKLWSTTGIGTGYSSPVVAGGAVFITGKKGNDIVLTRIGMNGGVEWQKTVGPAWSRNYPGSRGTPTVDLEKVYVLTGPGLLVRFDAKTGAKEWQVSMSQFGGRPASWGYSESPLVKNNLVVVTPGGGRCVVALSKGTGQLVWASSGLSDAAHYSSAIWVEYRDLPQIIQMTGTGMVGLDARNGRMLWRNNRACGRTAVCPSPVFADGYAFGASGYGNGGVCVKLDVSGGRVNATQAWETSEMVSHHGGYIIHEGHIYGNHSGGWNCLELATGAKKWGQRGVGKGSVCYADGMLYTFGENGGQCGLVEAKPGGFNMVSRFSAAGGGGKSWAHPVVIGGRLYLRWGDTLSAHDVRDPSYTPPVVAKPKPKPAPVVSRPKPKPMPRAKPRERTPEELARRLWNSANNFIRNNAVALGERKLKEIIEKYPDTKYAGMAREKLKELAAGAAEE